MNREEELFLNNLNLYITQNTPDPMAAKKILRDFPSLTNSIQNKVLFTIGMLPEADSLPLFTALTELKNLEDEVWDKLFDLILDKSRSNPDFMVIFLEGAKKARIREAVPLLASALLTETDPGVLFTIIMALGEAGDTSCVNVIGDFIFYDNETLKQAAIAALESIGGHAAIERLLFAAETSKRDPFVVETLERLTAKKQQAADAKENIRFASRSDTLASLDDDSDLAQLIKMLQSDSVGDRHTAIDLLTETGPKAIPAVRDSIDYQDSDSIINALDILGNIGNIAALPAIMQFIEAKHKDANVRFAAYEALYKLPPTKSVLSLIEGLTDPEEQVRIAAACAIENNLSDILIAGLKDQVETGGKKSSKIIIVEAILDAKACNTFEKMLSSDSFTFLAINYLQTTCEQIQHFYSDILLKRGTKSLAGKILEGRPSAQDQDAQKKIFIVDDSSVMLMYYIKLIHQSGHIPFIFNTPQAAIEAVQASKPDILITDLNMLKMNGLQLAGHLRQACDEDELPIVIVTTQSDFVQAAARKQPDDPHYKALDAVSIHHVIHKPLTKDLFLLTLSDIENTKMMTGLHSGTLKTKNRALSALIKNGASAYKTIKPLIDKNNDRLLADIITFAESTRCRALAADFRQLILSADTPAAIKARLIEVMKTLDPSMPVDPMIDLMGSDSPLVRAAAANYVDHCVDNATLSLLKTVIDRGSQMSRFAATAIIDGHAANILTELSNSDAFMHIASDYLSKQSTFNTIDFFIRIFEEKGRNALARSIRENTLADKRFFRKKVVIINRSPLFQNAFDKLFFTLKIEAICFKTHGEAIQVVDEIQPDYILTDMYPEFILDQCIDALPIIGFEDYTTLISHMCSKASYEDLPTVPVISPETNPNTLAGLLKKAGTAVAGI